MNDRSTSVQAEGELLLASMRALAQTGKGNLFVFSGPSGVGKDALLDAYTESTPQGLCRCVTATTRAPRDGEVDGVDYLFRSQEQFLQMIDQGELLEWALVHGNYYGTPRFSVEALLASGSDVVLKIDVQGGLAVKDKLPETIMIFVAPPSFAELEKRLRGRDSETEAELELRLQNALSELRLIPQYDYLIINDSLESAAGELAAIIAAQRHRIRHANPEGTSPS